MYKRERGIAHKAIIAPERKLLARARSTRGRDCPIGTRLAAKLAAVRLCEGLLREQCQNATLCGLSSWPNVRMNDQTWCTELLTLVTLAVNTCHSSLNNSIFTAIRGHVSILLLQKLKQVAFGCRLQTQHS